jgi:adenine-specific DNA methylase
VSETTTEIARQIRLLGIKAKTLLIVDENTLRVHQKRGRYVYNTDITYVHGLDLYNVIVNRIDFKTPSLADIAAGQSTFGDVMACEYLGVYADQLDVVVGTFDKARATAVAC